MYEEYDPTFPEHEDFKYQYHDIDEFKFSEPNDITVAVKEKVLCETRSVVGVVGNAGEVSAAIPANAAITKIFASIAQRSNAPIDSGLLQLFELSTPEAVLFSTDFAKSPFNSVGGYETAFEQPLCIGPNGARAALSSYRDNMNITAHSLRLTVVFCPDYTNRPEPV